MKSFGKIGPISVSSPPQHILQDKSLGILRFLRMTGNRKLLRICHSERSEESLATLLARQVLRGSSIPDKQLNLVSSPSSVFAEAVSFPMISHLIKDIDLTVVQRSQSGNYDPTLLFPPLGAFLTKQLKYIILRYPSFHHDPI